MGSSGCGGGAMRRLERRKKGREFRGAFVDILYTRLVCGWGGGASEIGEGRREGVISRKYRERERGNESGRE